MGQEAIPIFIRDGEPIKYEPRFTIIPMCHLLQADYLKQFSVTSGDVVQLPPYEEMQICKVHRTPYAPEECDYLVAVLINGERRWLSLEPIVLLKCLSGLTVTIK